MDWCILAWTEGHLCFGSLSVVYNTGTLEYPERSISLFHLFEMSGQLPEKINFSSHCMVYINGRVAYSPKPLLS